MSANKKLLILAGDGIGPEVMTQVGRVTDWMAKRRTVSFDVTEGLVGGACYDAHGSALTDETMADAMAESLHMSTAKLFIHPLLVWVSMTMLFDIPDAWVTAAVLTAAAPVAGNVYIIASNYDVYALRASTAVLISTAIAVVSFSALVAFLV